MRRSDLGKGRGRSGLSGPAALVCFFSSALGRYVPSFPRFFRKTHSRTSRSKVSREERLRMNDDITGGIHTWTTRWRAAGGRRAARRSRETNGQKKSTTSDPNKKKKKIKSSNFRVYEPFLALSKSSLSSCWCKHIFSYHSAPKRRKWGLCQPLPSDSNFLRTVWIKYGSQTDCSRVGIRVTTLMIQRLNWIFCSLKIHKSSSQKQRLLIISKVVLKKLFL